MNNIDIMNIMTIRGLIKLGILDATCG